VANTGAGVAPQRDSVQHPVFEVVDLLLGFTPADVLSFLDLFSVLFPVAFAGIPIHDSLLVRKECDRTIV
jgi:hypothetical protein